MAGANIRWDRLSRYGLLAIFAVLLFLYVNPARSYVHTLRQSHAAHAQLRALQRENARLRAQRNALGQPDVLAAEARQLGMVKPGERAYVVRGLPPGN